MMTALQFARMIFCQQVGRQKLERRPEPDVITDASDNVLQYDRAMTSKLVLTYVAGVDIIHRARTEGTGGRALDLACGPGHYTLCLANYLGYQMVAGMDMSRPMVETATQNALAHGLESCVHFQVRDITQLEGVDGGQYDLASFTNAAHHMPDLETVARIVRQMDRLAKPQGLVMVMDLARLRTEKLTERYIDVMSTDYVQRGLSALLDDFRNSMYAEWTTRELRTVIPRDSQRWWCHLVLRGLPTLQAILGLPVGRKRVYVRPGFSPKQHPLVHDWHPRWQREVSPQWADETLNEWTLFRRSLLLASKKMVRPTTWARPSSTGMPRREAQTVG